LSDSDSQNRFCFANLATASVCIVPFFIAEVVSGCECVLQSQLARLFFLGLLSFGVAFRWSAGWSLDDSLWHVVDSLILRTSSGVHSVAR
jgi:hypothetical protein